MRALNSQLVWLGHSSFTFKFMLETHMWTWVPPTSKVNILRSGVSHVCQKSCLSSWWWLQVYQKFPQLSVSYFFFHNSSTVPVSAMLFQEEQQLPLTQRTHISMLKSFRGYRTRFTRVQNRTSALKTKPNEANTDCSCCKAEFSPVVKCCMPNSTLDSDFYGILQSEGL